MHVKSHIASIVGPTDATRWGQILLLPHAYGVLEVVDDKGSAEAIGLSVLSQVSRLLERPVESLTQLESMLAEVTSADIRTLIALVPVSQSMYVVLRGAGAVLLKRGETCSWLLTGAGALSGEVKPGDTIIAASARFNKIVSKDILARIIDHKTPEDIAEQLTLLLHQHTGAHGSAALVFQVAATGESEVITEPIKEPVVSRTNAPRQVMKKFSSRAQPLRHFATSQLRALANFRSQPKRIQLFITIILTALFLVSVGFGIWKQKNVQDESRIVEVMNQARHSYEEGVALMPLNGLKGRERLVEAKETLAPLLATTSERSASGKEVRELYRLITDAFTSALQIYRVTPAVFYDVSLLKKGGLVADMVLGIDVLGLIDASTRSVYAVTISSKKGEVVGGGEGFEGLSRVTSQGSRLYALGSAGIHMVDVADNTTKKNVVPHDAQWGTIVSLVSYGGNQYLLDSAKGRIWKYVAVGKVSDASFSERREYLNPDAFPDLSRATSMAIDGSIWVGTTDGNILRFTQGKENPLVTQGVEPAFSGTLLVYTSDDTEAVYVLEPQAKRVVMLDKEGMYMGQYQWDVDIKPTAIAVSEEAKLLFLLARGTVYTIALK